nr:hypothetical protein [uncultured Albidiferax sp.]
MEYWWRTQAGGGPWLAQIRWQLQPYLDWLDQGRPAPPLYLQATVELAQSDSTIQWSAQDRLLRLDTSRVWQARLQLALSDRPGAVSARFYDRRAQVYLPAGPWETPFP